MSETEWIWGAHPVLEALRAGTVQRVLLAEGRSRSAVVEELLQEAARQAVPVRSVNPRELARHAPAQNTQGVVAAVRRPPTIPLAELLAVASSEEHVPLLLVLDQIQDPQNLGAILRTADAARVDGVVLPQRRSAPLSGVAAKTSAGAIHHLPIAEVSNLARALQEVRDRGIWTVGLDESADLTAYDVDLSVPLAVVVGSEGTGLRRLTRDHCDLIVSLPMAGRVASLNASVAAGIALYEVVRQRRQAGR